MRRWGILIIIAASLLVDTEGQVRGRFPGRGSSRRIIQLTAPTLKGAISFEEALAKRRSVRAFSPRLLSFSQIGQLAWAGQGITDQQRGLRTAPSAGALYPIELFFATPEGLFVYRPQGHVLEQIAEQDIRPALASAAGGQQALAVAACDIVIAGSARKLAGQFREKARTYMLLEAGHVAQNIQLQAVCMGLGSVPIGGFDSRAVRRLCKLTQGLEAIYLMPVGYPLVAEPTPTTGQRQPPSETGVGTATGKKAVLIVPTENFHDEEFFETKRALDLAGVETTVASTRPGQVRGMFGNTVAAEVPLNRVRVEAYDAVIFIGGSGAVELFDSPMAWNIAKQAANQRKILAAISNAPVILANARVLVGFRVTALVAERERLQAAGAVYTGLPIERDRFIITASGPMASVQFGRAIVTALSQTRAAPQQLR